MAGAMFAGGDGGDGGGAMNPILRLIEARAASPDRHARIMAALITAALSLAVASLGRLAWEVVTA